MNTYSVTLAHSDPILRVLFDQGKGRPFIILAEASWGEQAQATVKVLAASARVLQLEAPRIDGRNEKNLLENMRLIMQERGIRQAGFVSFGAAGTLVQGLALGDLKLVRAIIFVDATTRPHPTRYQRILDRIEHTLPLGLPLRSQIENFDAKPYLQRMRCPVLVVTSAVAAPHVCAEAAVFAQGLPTAWHVELGDDSPADSLARLVLEFQDVPVRCPQKNR